jgi:hypothetical protein
MLILTNSYSNAFINKKWLGSNPIFLNHDVIG